MHRRLWTRGDDASRQLTTSQLAPVARGRSTSSRTHSHPSVRRRGARALAARRQVAGHRLNYLSATTECGVSETATTVQNMDVIQCAHTSTPYTILSKSLRVQKREYIRARVQIQLGATSRVHAGCTCTARICVQLCNGNSHPTPNCCRCTFASRVLVSLRGNCDRRMIVVLIYEQCTGIYYKPKTDVCWPKGASLWRDVYLICLQETVISSC
jgi:hypothetical protein